jgi:hypothetical protein
MVEAGFLGLTSILILPPAGQGNQGDIASPRLLPNTDGDVVAVQLGKTDVQQDQFGPKLLVNPPPLAVRIDEALPLGACKKSSLEEGPARVKGGS